jgi:eukaryotic-like serine/threonine-protein kinase
MFRGILQFVKSKTFFKHLALFLLCFFIVCWIIIKWLGSYTSHGETLAVPDFSGVKISELDKFVSDKKVRYLIIDSIYDLKSPPGVVVKQEPEPNELVKEDRTIYLYVTSILPPSIEMPKLVDRSLRQAAAMIITYGLKMGKQTYRADQCANCILEQWVKGKKIEPGTTIPKGTVIDLVVGKGLSDEEVGVPCLYGLSKREATKKLVDASLTVGSTIYEVEKDSAASRVYKQIPSCGKETTLNLGSTVDLYLTADKSKWLSTNDTIDPDDGKNFDH